MVVELVKPIGKDTPATLNDVHVPVGSTKTLPNSFGEAVELNDAMLDVVNVAPYHFVLEPAAKRCVVAFVLLACVAPAAMP